MFGNFQCIQNTYVPPPVSWVSITKQTNKNKTNKTMTIILYGKPIHCPILLIPGDPKRFHNLKGTTHTVTRSHVILGLEKQKRQASSYLMPHTSYLIQQAILDMNKPRTKKSDRTIYIDRIKKFFIPRENESD